MAVSNIASGVLAVIVVIIELRKVCRRYGISFWNEGIVREKAYEESRA